MTNNTSNTTGFRDELIATSVVMSVVIFASFFTLGIFFSPKDSDTVLGIVDTIEEPVKDESPPSIVQESPTEASPIPSPTPVLSPTPTPETVITAATPTPTPKIDVPTTELSYGTDQSFEDEQILLEFIGTKLLVGTSQTLKTKVVLANKNIENGIKNTLFGVIEKDGQVVKNQAPISVTENKIIMPGQKLTFYASIALPDSTTITEIFYINPKTNKKVSYLLGPSSEDKTP